MPPDERQFARPLVDELMRRGSELDAELADVTTNWRLERLGVVERCVLRLAAAELDRGETPPRVVIQEAVHLAERYGSAREREVRQRRDRRVGSAHGAHVVRILVVNWQDRENPQAGGAEIHLHEIFGRLAAKGHEVRLLCGGWPGCPPRATLDGDRRLSRRHAPQLSIPRAPALRAHLARWADVLVEDINKVPLYTPRWGGPRRSVALVPHLFGSTAFQELPAPLAAAVWMAERPLGRVYRGVPFEAISESTADDLARARHRRARRSR